MPNNDTPNPGQVPDWLQIQQGTETDELLRELAPLMLEDGIDLYGGTPIPMETLQAAINHALERRELELFSPTGPRRDIAIATLQRAIGAILEGDSERAADQLRNHVTPESQDNTVAEASSCIGISLGLLDDWLSGRTKDAPAGLANSVTLPPGHWDGERPARDILALARKGRASGSIQKLIVSHSGGQHVLFGASLALAAVTSAWAKRTGTSGGDLIPAIIR
jgi:hypothetical protein